MSTTPPEEPLTPDSSTTGRTGFGTTVSGPNWLTGTGEARMPIPGNAEFLLYLVALIIAWLVCWFTDSLTANNWFTFFMVITAVYILSRGIAKASRVLEQ